MLDYVNMEVRGMAAGEVRIDLCATDDIETGTVIKVEAGDLSLAVYNVEGEFFVSDDHCTHGPGSLSEGYMDGYIVECDFHNGAFDVRTGEMVWAWDLAPPDKSDGKRDPESGWMLSTPNVWAPMAVDEERGLLFVSPERLALDALAVWPR